MAGDPNTREILDVLLDFRDAVGQRFDRVELILGEHTRILGEHSGILEDHTRRLDSIDRRLTRIEDRVEVLEHR